ncbi:TipAS antibiotic-recognition domain-containing protein [Solwaraspora sp. WMMD1047]|uniref:MerR family transcriptional regulator n=1 Tax=Solwaraspora sp. WMMD1047 TaxID=3016102 RepID=UPI002417B0AA|nr:TipAS antibiotic-recognition domain-containing protein [Solwaraspora sp. WMMD1047]MDG4829168.1 TipAS antibiotic-recognition domain-containing protein [Solwaraspora sp. WMMD1047]
MAREAGVTSRTLRHYHAIGLLTPAWTAEGGRRYYEQEQLLRLQRILLLRELGLGLDAVAEVLSRQGHDSAVEVLQRHRDWLVRERDRLDRLVHTVDTTICNIQEGREMTPRKVFAGFETNPYEAEARQRWGDAAVDAADQRMQGWSDDDAEQARTGYVRVHEGLAPLKAAGVPVTDQRVQDLIQLHYEVTCLFWTPNREAYQGLAQMYVEDERFRANIGGGDDALVEYLRDAMLVYADQRLDG